MSTFCDCVKPCVERASVNLTSKCPHCKVFYVDSHEYQMEGFVYTCVILLFYLLLTTIFMVKIICFKPHDEKGFDADERAKQRDNAKQVLKKFGEKEKQGAADSVFELYTRKQNKKQMIGYLKSINNCDSAGGGQASTNNDLLRQDTVDETTNTTTTESFQLSRKSTAGEPMTVVITNTDDDNEFQREEYDTTVVSRKCAMLPVSSASTLFQWKNEQDLSTESSTTDFYL